MNAINAISTFIVVVACLLLFGLTWAYFPPNSAPEKLAAVGQFLGAAFSALALVVIVYNQVTQSRALNVQSESLQVQQQAIIAQLAANELTLKETNKNIVNGLIGALKDFLEREAGLIVATSSTISRQIKSEDITGALSTNNARVSMTDILLLKPSFVELISRETGPVTKYHVQHYVSQFEIIQDQCKKMQLNCNLPDLFDLSFSGTTYKQLYAELRSITRASQESD
jgi:hypothetical protein